MNSCPPKSLKLSQESVSSGFGNDSPLSDEELDVTVISSIQRAESFIKSTGNTQRGSPLRSKLEEEKPSACTDAVNLQMQDVTVEGDEVGSTPSDIPIYRNDSGPKEVKGNRGCKRSVKHCK